MRNFEGKVAVVTGAGSGIGAALARQASALGAAVVLADVDEDGLAETATDLLEAGGDCLLVRTDVSDAAAVGNLAEQSWAAYGQVDLLFNNAGVLVDGVCWERTLADWRWCLEVNLMGCIHGIHHFVPRMVAQNSEGAVVNTSSVAGLLAGGMLGPYTVSKHGVFALTEVLANDLHLRGSDLRAHVLCPGAVATRIWNSEETRPEEMGPPTTLHSDAERAFRQQTADTVSAGTEPATVAEKVFDAIRDERFHIFPHPGFLPRVEQRFATIISAGNPVDG